MYHSFSQMFTHLRHNDHNSCTSPLNFTLKLQFCTFFKTLYKILCIWQNFDEENLLFFTRNTVIQNSKVTVFIDCFDLLKQTGIHLVFIITVSAEHKTPHANVLILSH